MTDLRDRFDRGELTAAEARSLAQQSLDDPELFDDLTVSALVRSTLQDKSVAKRLTQPARRIFPWKPALAAAAAVIVAISVYLLRPSHPVPAMKPALASAAAPGQPILLAGNLDLIHAANQPVFRGDDTASRPPRQTGSVISIEAGVATIDLGSLDGIAKGTSVFSGANQFAVATVFRDRARINARNLHKNDPIKIADPIFLDALLQHVEALSAKGDAAAARTTAVQAAPLAESVSDPKLLAQLAALEYRLGLPAEKHFEQAGDFNALGVIQMLRGDYPDAQASLAKAAVQASSLNNLAALAELRGDRDQAVSLYRQALQSAAPETRPAIETNLARLKSVR